MPPYKFLPHMVDSAISVSGSSREEVLNSLKRAVAFKH